MFDPMKQDAQRQAAGVEQPEPKPAPSVSWDNAPKGGNGSFGTPPPTGGFGMGPYNPNGKPGSTSGGVPPGSFGPPKGPATMPGPPQSYGPQDQQKGPATMPGPPGGFGQMPTGWQGGPNNAMPRPGQHWGKLSPDGASTQPGWFQNQIPEQTMGAQQGVPTDMSGMDFLNRLRRMRGMGPGVEGFGRPELAPPPMPRAEVTPFVNRPQDTTGPVEGPPPVSQDYGNLGGVGTFGMQVPEGFMRPELAPPPMPYNLFNGAPQDNGGAMNPALQRYMQSF